MACGVACGARTGLFEPDAAVDMPDATMDSPADVAAECAPIRYCDQSDLQHVYACGQPVQTCTDPLTQCEEREDGASCVNPCLDSLGNNTSNGCEFYAVEMDMTPTGTGVCYAVFVVNQWETGALAKITVDLNGQNLPIEPYARIPVGKGTGITYAPFPVDGLATNQVAILFLSRDPTHAEDGPFLADPGDHLTDPAVLADCPPGVTPAIVGDAAFHGTGVASAFHIKTNVPVVAYQMLPYGGGRARVTGSTLLLPTSAWDSNYVIADAYAAPSQILLAGGPDAVRAGPTTVIIASQDSTHVIIKPTSDIVGDIVGEGPIGPSPAHASALYKLNKGEYLQFTQTAELTGSAVQADAPIAVIGGATLMDVPVNVFRADSAEQMLPPVRALGSEYVAVRYRNRGTTEESVPWRIVGVVDGTNLTFDPPQPGAPTTVGANQPAAEFNAPGPFVVSSDGAHPFYLAAYMSGGCGAPEVGGECPSGSDPLAMNTGPLDGAGDPEFLNVVPPGQYLPRYTFFTDPTYPETNLVVVRERDPQTGLMPDVGLDCAGTLTGWTAVGSKGLYEMTRIDLSTGDFQGVGSCDNGVHTIAATIPGAPTGSGAPVPHFGVTIWGWGSEATYQPDRAPLPLNTIDEGNPKFTRWVSYGYPAGANFQPLNTVVLPAQ
jgi:IgGFc binding protein